jgi:3',5'-cyclic-AMP phosphodiesterase
VIEVAQISDCHLFADADKTSYGQIAPYLSLEKVFQNLANRQIDLMLVTGDLSADGSAESYRHFNDLLIKYNIIMPYVILPGNHDNEVALKQHFAAQHLWSYYPVDAPLTLANWQFHMLNTKTQGTSGHVPKQTLAELAQSIQGHKDYFQLIAAHHHPMPCMAWMDAHGWNNGEDLVNLLQRFTSVKTMIYGHIHAANEQVVDACTYLSCPSTCWQWAMQSEFGLSNQSPGYRLLTLTETGQVNTKIIRVEYP